MWLESVAVIVSHNLGVEYKSLWQVRRKQLKSFLEFLITLTYSMARCMLDLQSEHLVGIIVGYKIPL